MARFRKIDPRIWHDERFTDFGPPAKLAWLALLTHPCMTPMGAGMVYPGLIDSIIGTPDGEILLETFRDTSLIYRDKGLVIIKNYLLYNRPDNPNVLYSWIASCEELPRSDCFRLLHDHLQTAKPTLPPWIFAGLLKPLADQQNRTLADQFWSRTAEVKPGTGKTGGKVSRNVSAKVPGNVSVNVPRNHPRNQEQEQEQEQEQKQKEEESVLVSIRFDSFWQEYPARNGKKLEKAATFSLFKQLSPEDQSAIIVAARHYAQDRTRTGISPKDPKRFIRDGKGNEPWRDWIEPSTSDPQPVMKTLRPARPSVMDEVLEMIER